MINNNVIEHLVARHVTRSSRVSLLNAVVKSINMSALVILILLLSLIIVQMFWGINVFENSHSYYLSIVICFAVVAFITAFWKILHPQPVIEVINHLDMATNEHNLIRNAYELSLVSSKTVFAESAINSGINLLEENYKTIFKLKLQKLFYVRVLLVFIAGFLLSASIDTDIEISTLRHVKVDSSIQQSDIDYSSAPGMINYKSKEGGKDSFARQLKSSALVSSTLNLLNRANKGLTVSSGRQPGNISAYKPVQYAGDVDPAEGTDMVTSVLGQMLGNDTDLFNNEFIQIGDTAANDNELLMSTVSCDTNTSSGSSLLQGVKSDYDISGASSGSNFVKSIDSSLIAFDPNDKVEFFAEPVLKDRASTPIRELGMEVLSENATSIGYDFFDTNKTFLVTAAFILGEVIPVHIPTAGQTGKSRVFSQGLLSGKWQLSSAGRSELAVQGNDSAINIARIPTEQEDKIGQYFNKLRAYDNASIEE